MFRGSGICEMCLERVRERDPHHIFSRGTGRLDIKVNLVSVCRVFSGGRNCHALIHDGHIKRRQLVDIAARRERVTPESIEDCIYSLRRAPKGSDPEEVMRQWLRPA